MLAGNNPLTFISGAPIDLADKLKNANRAEFHHLMPRKFLSASGQTAPNDSVLANFTFITRAENRTLGGKAPSEYKAKMDGDVSEILASAIIPGLLFDDVYAPFIGVRSEMLFERARGLCGLDDPVEAQTPVGHAAPPVASFDRPADH
jgi:hypothetical protein